jgi:outer membrane receptor protein involved in Fe transport
VRGNPYGSLEGDVNGSGFSTSQFRLTNVERVEVLKGPASVLYGSGEPGGIINYVSRRPKEQLEGRVTLGSGSFDQRLGEAEITGPAGASGRLLYRGAVYFEDRDHFRNNAGNRNLHAVAGAAWKPSPQTTVALSRSTTNTSTSRTARTGCAASRWTRPGPSWPTTAGPRRSPATSRTSSRTWARRGSTASSRAARGSRRL